MQTWFFKPECDEKQPVFRRSEPHLKEMKGYVNVELLQKDAELWLYVEYSWLFGLHGHRIHCIYSHISNSIVLVSRVWFADFCVAWLSLSVFHLKSRLGRVGGVECQRCVSFVFIVLTGAQWYDCVAIWNPTPTQSFWGSEVGEMCVCVPLARPTMHSERPRNQRVIHPAYHQNHSASPRLAHIPDLLIRSSCKMLSFSKYKWWGLFFLFLPFPLLLCSLSHYFKVPFEEWPALETPQCDGQDHKAEQ